MTKKITHPDIFDRAIQLAKKSCMTQQHAAIIVKDREIIAEGINHHISYFEHQYSIHAEVDALSQIKYLSPKFIQDCTMLVVRVGPKSRNYPIRNSKPCENCAKAIQNYGIKKVFYSTDLF